MLHAEQIFRFEQLASLDDDAVDTLQSKLAGFPDRIRRDEWVRQARNIVNGIDRR